MDKSTYYFIFQNAKTFNKVNLLRLENTKVEYSKSKNKSMR